MKDSLVHNSISRRHFLQMAGLALGAATLAACAPAAAPATAPAAAGEQTTISWWNGFSTPTVQEIVPQIIGDFEAKHPNIRIEYEISGGPPGGAPGGGCWP